MEKELGVPFFGPRGAFNPSQSVFNKVAGLLGAGGGAIIQTYSAEAFFFARRPGCVTRSGG